MKVANVDASAAPEKTAATDHDDDADPPPSAGGHRSTISRTHKPKKYSPTDPDATLATSSHAYRMEPCYKQHTAVDDHAGIIVDVHVTTGEASEGRELEAQIDRVQAITAKPLEAVTNDAGYAHAANYGMLEERGIEAIIPPQRTPRNGRGLPLALFQYDAKHQIVRCPEGRVLSRRGRSSDGQGWTYRAAQVVCQGCSRVHECVPPSAKARTIRISDDYPALLRARRRHRRRDERFQTLYRRHRWRSEGVHAETKCMHGLRRAVRRGLSNMRIQSLLTATVINLKRMAKAAASLLRGFLRRYAAITRHSIATHEIARTCRAIPPRDIAHHILTA
jgi:hypothetical protein